MKIKNKQKQAIKSREKQFIHNWPITQRKKDYQAMEDKHASYYFSNKSVRKHLKQMKKAVKQIGSSLEKQRLTSLMNTKIKNKLPNIGVQKIQVYAKQLNLDHQESAHIVQKIVNRRSTNYIPSPPKKQLMLPQVNNSKTNQYNTSSSIKAQKSLQSQLIHNQKHNQFLNFLNKKKQILKKQIETSRSQLSFSQPKSTQVL